MNGATPMIGGWSKGTIADSDHLWVRIRRGEKRKSLFMSVTNGGSSFILLKKVNAFNFYSWNKKLRYPITLSILEDSMRGKH